MILWNHMMAWNLMAISNDKEYKISLFIKQELLFDLNNTLIFLDIAMAPKKIAY